ncbi:FAD:protein FMN transferase [Geoalkalibacter halelectricus]|uniref:FAD:protein FMN transferase n=1 Tax=Geoalkalibacter halelectricus TaxID=2847045 RepID=A0ABY5ZRH2_9BACT|nr:FAD:protein FMN transferase [Geoalkalibacter halelectricus]MDO3378396.1 FAD:protein FMN transferase [Geoalkalibacter halelectricus]UWZ80284.1 FAD:protein FMN transferase [Geoalkalibacter halelectricus]
MALNRPLILVLLVLAATLAYFLRGDAREQQVRQSRILMGTVVEINVLDQDARRAQAAVEAAFAEMARIEELMSVQRPDSEVARLGRAEQSLAVSTETAEVLALGLEIARRSAGAFDPSLGRLKALWDLEGDAPRIPEQAAIAAALEGIGPQALRLEGLRVYKAHPELVVDLGGIAKGYAVDRAVAVLEQAGIASASVNAGGDLRLLGGRGERPWRIGIQHPREAGEVLTILELSDRAVVTSGDYERYFEQDGRRYHHIFDPRTGFPADAVQSVTLVADSAMLADALATAVFVLGPRQGLDLVGEFPGVEVLIVDAAGALHASAGMAELQR